MSARKLPKTSAPIAAVPVALAAPLFLVETDLNAAIVSFNGPLTFSTIAGPQVPQWSFNVPTSGGTTTTSVGAVFRAGTKGGIFASWTNTSLSFENTNSGSGYYGGTYSPGTAIPSVPGNTIDGSLTFNDYAEFPANSAPTLYGFSIGGGVYYGWAEISTSGGSGGTLTIHRWAYEDTPGAAILAGAGAAPIPEPNEIMAGLTALALGAAVVQRKRRREKATANAED